MKLKEFLDQEIKDIKETQSQDISEFIIGILDKEMGDWSDEVFFEISKDSRKVELEDLSGKNSEKIKQIKKALENKFKIKVKI